MRTKKLAASDVESRSVDWIPHDERFGEVRDVMNVWFVGNVNLTAMATGFVALAVGANLFWTLVAIVLGSLFGTLFMAFHSAQGPQLGLPQLVQSRAQFGYIGAAVTVWVFALVNYVAMNTADAILSGSVLNEVFGVPIKLGFLIAATIATIIAMYGYSQIHLLNKLLFWPSIIALGAMTLGCVRRGHFPTGAFEPGRFELAQFMTVFVIAGGFQLGWAIYVSDYSRYLPATVGVRSTFWATYLPSSLSAIWVFALGAVASAPDTSLTPVAAFKMVGDSLTPGFGTILLSVMMLGLLAVMAVNAYGGSLTFISMADSIRPVKPTKAIRLCTIIVMGISVWSIAQWVGDARFNLFYSNVVVMTTYLFTPWTAVNLVDYFFIRKGRYVIQEIFNKNGIYGRWGWRGNTAYLLGFIAMVPFFVTTPYVGTIARKLGNADYSLFVGLVVSAMLYFILAQGIDTEKEIAIARKERTVDFPEYGVSRSTR
jgi:NCS1 family nucleobase:cation symporter-1